MLEEPTPNQKDVINLRGMNSNTCVNWTQGDEVFWHCPVWLEIAHVDGVNRTLRASQVSSTKESLGTALAQNIWSSTHPINQGQVPTACHCGTLRECMHWCEQRGSNKRLPVLNLLTKADMKRPAASLDPPSNHGAKTQTDKILEGHCIEQMLWCYVLKTL